MGEKESLNSGQGLSPGFITVLLRFNTELCIYSYGKKDIAKFQKDQMFHKYFLLIKNAETNGHTLKHTHKHTHRLNEKKRVRHPSDTVWACGYVHPDLHVCLLASLWVQTALIGSRCETLAVLVLERAQLASSCQRISTL